MSVRLQKGQKVSLSKDNDGLDKVIVGLGWDEASKGGLFGAFRGQSNIDCDASALVLSNGKLVDKNDIVFFWQFETSFWHYTTYGR